jgi:hypothetical protein
MIWGIMKRRFAAKNVEFGSNTVEMLQKIQTEMDGIKADECRASCRHVWDQEVEYLNREAAEDQVDENEVLEEASDVEISDEPSRTKII